MISRFSAVAAILAFFATTTAQPDEQALESSIAAIASIASASSPTFSPDGRQLAFVSNASGVPQLWRVQSTGGSPTQLTFLDDVVQSAYWSPLGDWIAFDVSRGGGFNAIISIIRPDGSETRILTKPGPETVNLLGWAPDGRSLRIMSNARDPTVGDALLLDIESGKTRQVTHGPGLNRIVDISKDGRSILISRLVHRGSDDLLLVDALTGKETVITPHKAAATFGWGQFASDAKRILLTSNRDQDLSAFAELDAGISGSPRIRTFARRADGEAERGALPSSGATAVLVWNVAGRSELSFFDARSLSVRKGPRLPAEVVSALEMSPRGDTAALVLGGAAAPADIFVADLRTGTLRQVTHSPHPNVDLRTFVRPVLIRYHGHDGLPLTGWLYAAPRARRPGPVVLSFHGGPEAQARPALNHEFQSLMLHGISVFQPNVRGSAGFGKRFINLDNGPLRINAIKDIKSTSDFLVSRGIADPRRLGILGGSYGGYMVLAAVTEYPDLFAAGADRFGIANFKTFFAQSAPWMGPISTVEYGDPSRNPKLMDRLSPVNRLDRIKTPLIVLHGANDTDVPIIEARQVVRSLEARNIPHEFVLFSDEGHTFRKLRNRVRSTVEITRFFNRYLNCGEGPGQSGTSCRAP